jgi:hypothetical protein
MSLIQLLLYFILPIPCIIFLSFFLFFAKAIQHMWWQKAETYMHGAAA